MYYRVLEDTLKEIKLENLTGTIALGGLKKI